MVVSRLAAPIGDALCIRCDQKCSEMSLRCDECKEYIHVACSELPIYYLLQYFKNRSAFYCEICVIKKYGDCLELEAKIKTLRDALHTRHKDASSGHSPSAPSASQVLTQPDLDQSLSSHLDVSSANHDATLQDRDSQRTATDHLTGGTSRDESKNGRHVVTTGGLPNNGQQNIRSATVCTHYRKKNCKFGRKGVGCKFSHPNICRRFVNYGDDSIRGCSKKRECKYMHPAMCFDSLKRNKCTKSECKYYHLRNTIRDNGPASAHQSNNFSRSDGAEGRARNAGFNRGTSKSQGGNERNMTRPVPSSSSATPPVTFADQEEQRFLDLATQNKLQPKVSMQEQADQLGRIQKQIDEITKTLPQILQHLQLSRINPGSRPFLPWV